MRTNFVVNNIGTMQVLLLRYMDRYMDTYMDRYMIQNRKLDSLSNFPLRLKFCRNIALAEFYRSIVVIMSVILHGANILY